MTDAPHSSASDGVSGNSAALEAVMHWAVRASLRWWWLCALILVAFGCGAYLLIPQFVPLRYTATGALMLQGVVGDSETGGAGEPLDVRSAVQLARSTESLEELLKEFKLAIPVDEIQKDIEVENEPSTQLIRVSLTWSDPAEAAAMVNRLMELFNQKNNKARRKKYEDAIIKTQLPQQIEEAAGNATKARQLLQQFVEEHKINDITTDLAAQRSESQRAEMQLAAADQERRTLETNVATNRASIEAAIKAEIERLEAIERDTAPGVTGQRHSVAGIEEEVAAKQNLFNKGAYAEALLNRDKTRLNVAKSELDRLEENLSNTEKNLELLKDRNTAESAWVPTLDTLLAQRASYATQLKKVDTKIAGLNNEKKITSERLVLLRSILPEHRNLAAAVTKAEAKHQTLVDRRNLYQVLAKSDADEYTITETAKPPRLSTGRDRLKALVKVMAGAGILCVLLVLALECSTFPMISREAASQELGVPVIARPTVQDTLAGFLLGGRELDQEIRNLSLRVSQILTEPNRVVLGVQSRPQASLLPLFVPLADCFARRDERVVIVDLTCSDNNASREDLNVIVASARKRAGSSSGWSSVRNLKQLGVAEYLLGEADFNQVVHRTSIDHVDCIPAGQLGIPTDVLVTRRMDAMMRSLRDNYSIVLIAGPDETRSFALEMLIARADGVLLVGTSSGHTPPPTRQIVDKLAEVQAPVLGAALVTYKTSSASGPVIRKLGKAKWKEADA